MNDCQASSFSGAISSADVVDHSDGRHDSLFDDSGYDSHGSRRGSSSTADVSDQTEAEAKEAARKEQRRVNQWNRRHGLGTGRAPAVAFTHTNVAYLRVLVRNHQLNWSQREGLYNACYSWKTRTECALRSKVNLLRRQGKW